MHPAVHKYLYYLHRSTTFNRDRNAYLALLGKGKVQESNTLIADLKEKYEIPTHAIGDFLYVLHRNKTDPFMNYELGVTRKNEVRNFKVEGPAITLTIKSGVTRPQFESLWDAVNEAQVWEVEVMGLLADLGKPFEPIIFDKPKDFDLAFSIYLERKRNPKQTFKEITEKFGKQLLPSQGQDYVKKRYYTIRNLIESVKKC